MYSYSKRLDQQHAYTLENHIRQAPDTAKPIRKSNEEHLLHLEQLQVPILQLYRDRKTKAMQRHI
jgi:hypothetical protein